MSQSRMLDVGLDVHQESIAVAAIAQEHGAEVTNLGTLGTRPCDLAHLIRKMPSKAKQLVLVNEAGRCGEWLSRYRTKQGPNCWVVAPSLMPNKAGDRVNTDRRDAVPLARLRRSGALTPVHIPQEEDEALRDLTRAREAAIGDLKAATFRLSLLALTQYPRHGPGHLEPGASQMAYGAAGSACVATRHTRW